MRIQITKGGIYGQPTDDNPTGELPIGTKLTVEKAPAGWAGRYIDLDAETSEPGDDVDALKARVVDLEAIVKAKDEEIATLKAGKDGQGGGNDTPKVYEAKHRGAGSWSIMDGDTEVREKLTKEQAETFNKLDAEGRAQWLTDNPKA